MRNAHSNAFNWGLAVSIVLVLGGVMMLLNVLPGAHLFPIPIVVCVIVALLCFMMAFIVCKLMPEN